MRTLGKNRIGSGGRATLAAMATVATIAALGGMSPRRAAAAPETLAEIGARLGRETSEAYAANPFSALSKDYFLRFNRDPRATIAAGEIEITPAWRVIVADGEDPLVGRMAGHFADFMRDRMGVALVRQLSSGENNSVAAGGIITITGRASGAGIPEGFTIRVEKGAVKIESPTPAGARDGVVRLVDMIGLRGAPFLSVGVQPFAPRLDVRLGAVPSMGSTKDLVFLGYNAAFAGGGNLHALSTSNAIPELAARRAPGLLDANIKAAASLREYGLKTYAFLDTRQKFPENDPVLAAHPEIRGARTWAADGEFVLCTEHPLVRQFYSESIEGLFRADPQLTGVVVIIGGEGFYHCFMRPFGAPKGHTNCERCEKLGPDTVVADLVNLMGEAARRVNPKAEIVIWPYSAVHVWSADADQSGLIAKLNPGVALLTEIEKDEYLEKEGGVRKHLWDYSIDMIGPGDRAKRQIAACAARGIPVYLKSEPELAFEAPRLPNIPCMDRWADRAEALASCGAKGAWVFPAFRANYATIAGEVAKFSWWAPAPPKEETLNKLAARLAGPEAAPRVREAWRRASEAVEYSPELPPYYQGPYYLGPGHPMCADPKAELPEEFYGFYLFMAEMTDAEGVKKRPTFFTSPRGDAAAFLNLYRKMEAALKSTSEEMNAARPLVPEPRRLMFDAEDSSAQWFYRTARTHANFYESCILRDKLIALAAKETQPRSAEEIDTAAKDFRRWLEVLNDELENSRAALPLMERDSRLNYRYGGDHTFEDGPKVIRAKIAILEKEILEFVPGLAKRCGAEIKSTARP